MTEDVWEGLVSVGFKGYFFACQRAAKHMLAQQRGGSLICLSSVHAVNPCPEWTVYGTHSLLVYICHQPHFCPSQPNARCAGRLCRGNTLPTLSVLCFCFACDMSYVGSCKAGLERMVKGLAVDLAGTGISANCIAPGGVANALPPPGKTERLSYCLLTAID